MDRIELNPFQCERLNFYEVDQHRRFKCEFYSLCLLFAGVKRWTSFSCINCKEGRENPPKEKAY